MIKNNKSKILIVTYGDGFSESLKKKILEDANIDISVLSLSFFSQGKKVSNSIINEILSIKRYIMSIRHLLILNIIFNKRN